MKKIPKTGKAQYEIDTKTKTYWYHGRNPEKKISKGEEERSRRQIEGFTRIFRDGRTKVFRYRSWAMSENLLKRRFLFGIIIR
jgi:hypothetical protein